VISSIIKLLGKRATMIMPGVFLVVAPSTELGKVLVWRVSPRIVVLARPRSGEERSAKVDVGTRVKAWLLKAEG